MCIYILTPVPLATTLEGDSGLSMSTERWTRVVSNRLVLQAGVIYLLLTQRQQDYTTQTRIQSE